MNIDWSKLPENLQKYKEIEIQEDLHNLYICNEESLKFLSDHDARSQAYKIFIYNYNEIQMNVNLQTNLYLAEEFHFIACDSDDFGFDIPKEYYEFSKVFNNPQTRMLLKAHIIDYNTFLDIIEFYKSNGYSMNEDDVDIITKTFKRGSEKLKIELPENMILENINKNEFLSLFSIFEAFLEDYCIEKQKELQLNNEEEIRKDINKKMRSFNIKESIEYLLSITNDELIKLIYLIRNDILNVLGYMGMIRNLHVHKLGIMTAWHFNQAIKLGYIKCGFNKKSNNKYYYEDILLSGEHIIESGQYITISRIVPLFRYYIKEIAFMLDACF